MSLARKAAQQINEELQGMPHDCDVCGAELVESMESIIEAALAPMREVLQALVDKLNVILPAIDAMCVMESIHGRPYTGPTLEKELARAAEVLKGQ